jgi:hypothetical protein
MVTITGISGTTIYIDSNGNGTAATPKFTYAHSSGIEVFNRTRNIKISASGSSMLLGKDDLLYGNINMSWVETNKLTFYIAAATQNVTYSIFSNCPNNGSGYFRSRLDVTGKIMTDNIIYGMDGSQGYGSRALNTSGGGTMGGPTANAFNPYLSPSYSRNLFLKNSMPLASGSQNLIFNDSWFYDNSTGIFGTTDNSYANGLNFACNNCKFGSNARIFTTNYMPIGWSLFVLNGGSITNAVGDVWHGGSTASNTRFILNGVSAASFPSYSTTDHGTDIRYQDYLGVSGRYLNVIYSGTVSDVVTGGQTASWSKGGSGNSIYINPFSTTIPVSYMFNIPVTASTDPQIKFFYKTTQTSSGPTMAIDVYDSDDDYTKLVDNSSITLTSASDWTQYSAPSISPTSTGFIRVVLKVTNGSSTGDVGIDDISFVSDGITYTDTCDRSKNGVPLIFGQGTGGSTTGGSESVYTWTTN